MTPAVIPAATLRRMSAGAAAFAMAVGLIVLLGWTIDDEALKRIVPFHDDVSMKTNTALGLALAGAGLLLGQGDRTRRIASRACAAAVLFIGLSTLTEYVFHLDLGIDQLLFHELPGVVHTSSPNRMAANTAFCFASLGAAVMMIDRRVGRRSPTIGLALIVAAVAGLALVGIAMGVTSIPGVSQQSRMALMTAVTFVVLAVSCFCAVPESTAMRRIMSAGPGGLAIRRLLPVAVILPVALGALRLGAERAGLFGAEVGTWMLIVAVMICLGGLVWLLSASIDRSHEELRQAEQKLRRAVAEAERASDAKSGFLSGMSHELRTPLNAILGFGQLLEFDDLTGDQRESVEHIITGGRHLLSLVNEVLDIARIESGKLAVTVEPVGLGGVLDEARLLIGPLAREREISVEFDHTAALPWQVLADAGRLKQIIINLLSNAVKYNRDHGWVQVRCLPRGSSVLSIVVADGGVGIEPADQARMFKPFERVGQKASEGTGLGLALARRLAELMGGSLEVSSVPGSGSEFTLNLPLTALDPQPTAVPRTSSSAGPPGAELTGEVLYIEDNPANVALVESFFARAPRLVLRTAATARDGLDAARTRPPDLILLDLHLPDMHGLDALRELRAQPEHAHTSVLILTADATPGQEGRLLAAGADGYLTKPLDMALLQAQVSRLLGPAVRPPSPLPLAVE